MPSACRIPAPGPFTPEAGLTPALAPTRAPAPDRPRRFRGEFLSDPPALARYAGASGPFRISPDAIARPVDAEDTAILVEWSVEKGIPLVPRGGGTGMPGGNVGRGVVVDTTAWQEVGPVDPDSRTVWAQPGVVADDLAAAARAAGLFLPALPSSSDRCRLGGMVANNAAGARSFGYGAMAAWVDGLDVVLADGTFHTLTRTHGGPDVLGLVRQEVRDGWGSAIAADWPAVAKNSSGYALPAFVDHGDPVSLLVGSEGTLGIVTGIHLRLAPEPAGRALALVALPSLETLPAVTDEARRVRASACEFFGRRFLELGGVAHHDAVGGMARDAEALVMLELDDRHGDLDDAMAALASTLRGLGLPLHMATDPAQRAALWAVRHAASPVVAARAAEGLVSTQFIEDCVVPPTSLLTYLVALQEILDGEKTDAVMFGHAGDANVHVNPLIDVRREGWRPRVARILEATVDLVSGLGGTLAGEHGDGRLRAPFHDRVWGPAVAQAFRHVKARLDPAGVLNPGVVVALPHQDPLEGLDPEGTR